MRNMASAPRDGTVIALFYRWTEDTNLEVVIGRWGEDCTPGWQLNAHDAHGCGCCCRAALGEEFLGWEHLPDGWT